MRRDRVVGVLVAVVTAGCSPGAGSPPQPGLSEAWRTVSITPIGQPVAAGETLVVYGTEGRDLFLYGVAIADGAIRWRKAATPSTVVAGIAVTPTVLDGRVAYFRPDFSANLAGRLVVAAPDDGRDLIVTEPALFRSHPAHCADGKDICVTIADAKGTTVSRRFSVDAGGPVPDRGGTPADSRFVGEALLDLGARDPEVLAGFEGGTIRWRSALSRHFSAGASTDWGWYFELYRSAGLYVGSVGRPADRQDRGGSVSDLSKQQTAALDAATGAPTWHEDGTRFACNGTIVLERTVAGDRSEPWPVRCRYHGTVRYDPATDATTYAGLDVTVEGFDVATGKRTWSVSLGPAEAFMGEEKATPVRDAEVLVPAATGPMIIDLSTGSTRAPAKAEVFWCSRNVWWDYRQSRDTRNGPASDWRGGSLLSACTGDGSPSTATPAHLAPSLGATIGERTVVAVAGALVAYDRNGVRRSGDWKAPKT